MKRALVTLAVLAALGGILAASVVRRNGTGRGVAVRAEPVERRSITQAVKASGQIDPRVKVNVSAHVVARIEKLHAREGDQVMAGQPFVELEKENFRAAHDRARPSSRWPRPRCARPRSTSPMPTSSSAAPGACRRRRWSQTRSSRPRSWRSARRACASTSRASRCCRRAPTSRRR